MWTVRQLLWITWYPRDELQRAQHSERAQHAKVNVHVVFGEYRHRPSFRHRMFNKVNTLYDTSLIFAEFCIKILLSTIFGLIAVLVHELCDESSNIFKSFLSLFCNLENEAILQHFKNMNGKFSKIHLIFLCTLSA